MMISEALNALEAASVQLHNPLLPQPNNLSAGSDHSDCVHGEHIWDLQDLIDRSSDGMSALQRPWLLGGNAG